jgi:hypothetical protein
LEGGVTLEIRGAAHADCCVPHPRQRRKAAKTRVGNFRFLRRNDIKAPIKRGVFGIVEIKAVERFHDSQTCSGIRLTDQGDLKMTKPIA